MTNFGALAILGLPKMPERQLRFLLALETITSDEDGLRKVGTKRLASKAGLSVNTVVKARGELVASGAIDYRRGNGQGQLSTYRMKVPNDAVYLPGPEKVPNDAGYLPAPERCPNRPREGTQTGSKKVPKRNAATSGNASGGLEPSGLDPVFAHGVGCVWRLGDG